jgi:hemerythrin
MAELTNLESKLAEVLGLAEASKGAAEKVKGMLDDDEQDLASKLDRMHEEAVETANRCIEVASGFDGKKTAIVEAARETKQEATEMMETYLEGEDDALDGFEFLTMSEAGEVGHWAIVKKLNERAGIASVTDLADWALPVQEEHLSVVLKSALELAGREDPNEVAE